MGTIKTAGKQKATGIRRCVEEIVFSFTYPRLDMEVFKQRKRFTEGTILHTPQNRVKITSSIIIYSKPGPGLDDVTNLFVKGLAFPPPLYSYRNFLATLKTCPYRQGIAIIGSLSHSG
ncbi:unnamed protein product [Lactuca saligna]|uniref:Uncharacterized protein n=1 Tax=Lactuca saligna TaxID=75948 RepID=A0AA35Z9K4_LACSI|nr:unnamed protein product [Lactuca saligna]